MRLLKCGKACGKWEEVERKLGKIKEVVESINNITKGSWQPFPSPCPKYLASKQLYLYAYVSLQKVHLCGEFNMSIHECVTMLWIKATNFHSFEQDFFLRLSGGTNTHSPLNPFKISEELLGFYLFLMCFTGCNLKLFCQLL